MPFSPEDAAQLEGLVPHVGVAVESLHARNKMRELAATDGLTGLYNHLRICELLRDEMRRAERYNRPLSVLMLDIDSFKSFNDSYGHPAGDQLLRSVAHLLRSGVRTVDKVGRYGGEEFIIIMPETHKDDAFMLAERIRSTVEQKAFIVVAGEEIHRTVSVGVASYPEDGLNPQEVFTRADEALYRAKDSGRNRVVWA
jgi:diguanylate cyclase (GGDEF)-like protein